MLFERPGLADIAMDVAHVAHQLIGDHDHVAERYALVRRALDASDAGELGDVIAEALVQVDAAVMVAAEWGETSAIHHALACGKELAVLDRILTHTIRTPLP